MNIKSVLLRLHVVSAVVVALNYIALYCFSFSLITALLLLVKLLFYFSATALFFLYRKPFTDLTLYLSAFVFLPVITLVSWILVYVGMILTYFYICFFFPWEMISRHQNTIVYHKSGNFLSINKNYKVTQKRAFVFEQVIAEFEIEHEAPRDIRMFRRGGDVLIKYKFDDHRYDLTEVDTTIVVRR